MSKKQMFFRTAVFSISALQVGLMTVKAFGQYKATGYPHVVAGVTHCICTNSGATCEPCRS